MLVLPVSVSSSSVVLLLVVDAVVAEVMAGSSSFAQADTVTAVATKHREKARKFFIWESSVDWARTALLVAAERQCSPII
jgi:hypothetical protein